MDILNKLETLVNAKLRSTLPRRERVSELDRIEKELLAEIREALAQVEAQERVLAQRLEHEQDQAQEAEQRGDFSAQRTHERRAFELDRQLDRESITAINLEEKLAALEEKLALAKEAVEKEERNALEREKEADKVIDDFQTRTEIKETVKKDKDERSLDERKSRLSG